MSKSKSTLPFRCGILLALVTVLGVVAGFWLIPRFQAAREEARGRPSVHVMGQGSSNHMTYDLFACGKSSPQLDQRISSALRRLVQGLEDKSNANKQFGYRIFTSLHIDAPALLNDSLAPVTELTFGLDSIAIDGVPVSHENIVSISRCRSLTGVVLRNTSMTDESFLALSDLPELQYLDVSGNPEITLSAQRELLIRKPNIELINEQNAERELPMAGL